MSDPQFNSVDTNSLESVGKGRKMARPKRVPQLGASSSEQSNLHAFMYHPSRGAPKRKRKASSDGDTAHWETAREKEKAMKAPRKSGIYVQPSKKIVTPVSESGRTVKYVGKSKVARKKISGK